MSQVILNKDVENVIMSFMSEYERLILLREIYTTNYLIKGLQKKNLKQISIIFRNLIEYIRFNEFSSFTRLFIPLGLDPESKVKWSNCEKWMYLSGGKKEEKIQKCIKLINRLYDIVDRKPVTYLVGSRLHPLRIDPTISTGWTLNVTRQDFYSKKIIKLLCLLVSIIKHPKNIANPNLYPNPNVDLII